MIHWPQHPADVSFFFYSPLSVFHTQPLELKLDYSGSGFYVPNSELFRIIGSAEFVEISAGIFFG